MLTMKQGFMISAIMDKLDIDLSVTKIDNGEKIEIAQKEMGARILRQIVCRAHKAKDEIYQLIIDMKKCSAAEAEQMDLVKLIKEIANDSNIKDFFKSADE